MAQRGTGGDGAGGPRRSEPPSIIAAGLRIIGNIECDGAVHIDGVVDGDVTCDDLTVGAAGTVSGQVNARFVRVLGKVVGTIQAKHAVISAGSRIVGDVIHEALVVEHGAWVDGFYRSAANVDISGTVDVREKIGQAFRHAKPPARSLKRSLSAPQPASETTQSTAEL